MKSMLFQMLTFRYQFVLKAVFSWGRPKRKDYKEKYSCFEQYD